MGRKFRLPMFVVAAAMFGLMAVLATLQYKWLGRISDAERERMGATLNTRATAFAQDFDRELTRAYLLFQVDGGHDQGSMAARLGARHDRWQATARFPRLISGVYVVTTSEAGPTIERYNVATRFVEPAEWPDSLKPLRSELGKHADVPQPGAAVVIRPAISTVIEEAPALVVATPLIFFDQRVDAKLRLDAPIRIAARLSYAVLMLDREYIVNEILPALAEQHFRGAGDGFDYQLAIVRSGATEVVYRSAAAFTPAADARADASIDLFQVRTQEFGALAAEVRRFATFVTQRTPRGDGPSERESRAAVSIIVPPGTLPSVQRGTIATSINGAPRAHTQPKWKLLVKHPSGSLETAVQAARRRNVLVSSGILIVLGVSMALLVLSTRRAQRLAARQMEFVAAVSHELRTPLAVIRSAGENLADGVIRDEQQIRKYGDLVRNEGRRLTEMVEQTLELAGIQSGQRGFALRPVSVTSLVDGVLESSAALISDAGIAVDIDIPESLPPVLGDEAALRRVFQNLIANAIKYGASGKWIGIRAAAGGRDVVVSVSDRGIGIAPSEHARIFEPFYRTPDVVAAQIQGAGLGLSLVKRIVDGHAGRIAVRSTPGEGSEFTVHLPIATQEPRVAMLHDRRQADEAATLRS